MQYEMCSAGLSKSKLAVPRSEIWSASWDTYWGAAGYCLCLVVILPLQNQCFWMSYPASAKGALNSLVAWLVVECKRHSNPTARACLVMLHAKPSCRSALERSVFTCCRGALLDVI
ncbi:hypothetical protein BJX99DRAFT_82928 [Aspergillus californicus]